MPYNGVGTFVALPPPDYPAVAGELVKASQHNNNMVDLFGGLSNAVTRDGQSPPTANLPMAGKRFTNAGDAVLAQEYLTKGQTASTTAGEIAVGYLPGGTGAKGTTVQNKLREIVSLTDNVGVDPTGVADSTTGIQAALDYAASINGKLIASVKGTYLIGSGLTVPSGLVADFGHSTIKRKTGSVFNMLENTGGTGIFIENLVIDGNRAADGRVATNVADRFGGIVLNSVTFSALRNVQANNTVNSEDGRAGVYLGNCTNVDLYNVGGSGNDRSCVFIDGGSFNRIFGSYTKDNLGSGVTSFSADDCEYYACTAINSGYSGISVNGLRCKANGLRSTGTAVGYGGINIGHNSAGNTADDSIIENIHSYSNLGWGVVVAGSARVQLRGVYSALNVNPNVYIFDASTACKIDGLVSSGSTAGSGVLITAGTGHSIANAEIFGNFAHGVDAETGTQVVLDVTVRCYNNGQGAAGLAGVLLNGSVGSSCYAECFDNQGTKTQGYGVWLAGGSGNIIGGYLHDNLTAPIRESGSPVYSTTKIRVGTNVMAGSFVPAAGVTTVTINNNNARTGMNVIFFAVNTAGTTLGIPRLGVITPGVSFVANLVATAVGTEGYGYVIL